MENLDNSKFNDTNIKHDLVTIASSDRLFEILDKKTQEKLLRFVYKYAKECISTLEQHKDLIKQDDEEFFDQYENDNLVR